MSAVGFIRRLHLNRIDNGKRGIRAVIVNRHNLIKNLILFLPGNDIPFLRFLINQQSRRAVDIQIHTIQLVCSKLHHIPCSIYGNNGMCIGIFKITSLSFRRRFRFTGGGGDVKSVPVRTVIVCIESGRFGFRHNNRIIFRRTHAVTGHSHGGYACRQQHHRGNDSNCKFSGIHLFPSSKARIIF